MLRGAAANPPDGHTRASRKMVGMPVPRRTHRDEPRRRRSRSVLTTLLLTALVVSVAAGCGSSDDDRPDVPTVTPASAVASPPGPVRTPPGTIVAAPAGARDMAIAGTNLFILGPAGTEVLRYGTAALNRAEATATRTPTPELTVIAADADASVIGAGPRTLVRIDASGRPTSTPTGVDAPTAIAVTADGRILIGTATGHVVVFDRELRQQRDIAGFVRVDDITVSPPGADLATEQVVVLDRAQSSVTPVDIGTGDLKPALRAGNGATTSTVDHYGRVLVANTRDNEIIGFFGSPLVMRFRYPVPDGPYAVDYDDTRNLLWVSTTGNNEVVAYDLADGEPREITRFATPAQPDLLATDGVAGTVYVLGGRDGGLQVYQPFTERATPRGTVEPGR